MNAFIGVGPGRCGTMSLARIVGSCRDAYVTHEAFPSDWYTAGPYIGRLIQAIRRGVHPNWPGSRGGLIGEVSCNLLPHIDALREPLPDLKVICLHRPKSEVISSFLARTGGLSLRPKDRPVWRAEMDEAGLGKPPERLPIIDAATAAQSWGFYWDMCEELMRRVKPPVLHVPTKSLKDDFSVTRIFDFLEIDLTRRVIPDIRVWNSSKERVRV